MTRGRVHERGVALVTTLLAVTLLTIAVVEFAYSSQVDYHLAYNALRSLQAASLARSGVNLAIEGAEERWGFAVKHRFPGRPLGTPAAAASGWRGDSLGPGDR